MSQPINIKTLNITELKALAFDLQNNIAFQQNNLKAVLTELQSRVDAPAPAAEAPKSS